MVGASGYTGEELLRLLSRHPGIELTAVTSRQRAGESLARVRGVHSRYGELKFEDLSAEQLVSRADVFFLSLPHGVAAEFAVPLLRSGKVVIDLSADFRLKDPATYKEFYGQDHPAPELLADSVYALPEIHRSEFSGKRLFACPGCYPTSVLLPLIPLLRDGALSARGIVINSLSGVSGAGKKADVFYSFSERDSSVMVYGWPKHRHLSEMEQELSSVSPEEVTLTFTPHLLPIVRGMMSTISAPLNEDIAPDLPLELLKTAYRDEPFVRVLDPEQDNEIRDVVQTNVCQIAVRPDLRSGRLQVVSVIDNLVKGASGQAVQVLNHLLGMDQTTGLEE